MTGVRPFQEADLRRWVEVVNASYPEYGWTEDEARHEDATWTDPKFFRARFVVEDQGRVVGALDLHHQRGWFDPRRYRCEIVVDPQHRRHGHGSALLARAEQLARERGGSLLIGNAKESMSESVTFLTKRGWVERRRAWESRLDVNAFDSSLFAGAEERVAGRSVRISTLAEELSGGDREAVLRRAFDLQEACRRDIPSSDPVTEGTFDLFRSFLEAPSALHHAFFLAVQDGEYLGLSNLWRDMTREDVLYQGLTGVAAPHRGKGIAMALKLHTVMYARAHGKREIRTWNDTANRPMLRINEAMGFVKQPVWIEFAKKI
jgi:GNAT superfamily N-acetyltransferase